MTNKYLLILGDHQTGSKIANWLAENHDQDSDIGFAIHEKNYGGNLELHSRIEFHGALSREESNELSRKFAESKNFLISCYWPWLFPETSFIGYEGHTLNFHPALLPRDKGWYPHVHQIRHNLPAGVTLHQISNNADGGAIWVQENVELSFPCTAAEARNLLQQRIVQTFKSNWKAIYSQNVQPAEQVGEGNFWSKSDVDKLDQLDLTENMTVEELIRAIACRNFENRSFLKVKTSSGEKYIHMSFSENGKI